MSPRFSISKTDLLDFLDSWEQALSGEVLAVACGGTALTLNELSASTKDVDLLIPDPEHYQRLIKALKGLGYSNVSGFGWAIPGSPWIFDLFRGQRIFQTELLDAIHEPGNHRIIKRYGNLTIGTLTPQDLMISKLFRGTATDGQDCMTILNAESIDLKAFAERYKETAGYDIDPAKCKKHLNYLIAELEESSIDATNLKIMSEEWIP
ncbi:MAG: hypothetical protein IPP57_11295 [Candidatus Obscuribacter sp.]|jgi:hypothetical protein|nr:hypothetical protein [Candidatus Obscuribacter sp.]MBK9620938.1 hypothetical protein [Candidatus Obscuribacter sp.]MBK9771393.1 hypothetical protein [Candidatus Obscuribacter sp.]